jgi:hypothetical protein
MSDVSPVGPAAKAFCVGQAKSGTASVTGLLATHYRAVHEPERAQVLDLILREARGELNREAVKALLIERDRRLNLEYDIAWANQFINDHLLAVFPHVRFIVLVRDPWTWLQSMIGHLIARLAEFLQIPLESLDKQRGHLNRSTWSGPLNALVEGTYLNDLVGEICGDHIARYFPGVSGLEDVSRLWGATTGVSMAAAAEAER